jgi:LysR family glycine cleavage system transcriptional activator
MSERVLPLRGIAVFEAAARSASFQAAADELNLTPSAVSHQIRLLEDILGVRLFDRVGRGVKLTADGAEYARSVRLSISRLRAATSEIRLRGKKGGALEVVRIEMPPSFAHCWLVPHLTELMDRLPGVDIRINAQGSHLQGDRMPFPQLADAPADVQIVYGDSDIWEDRATLLISEIVQPYCSPGFLQMYAPKEPEDLTRHLLISTAQNVVSWEEWLNLQGVDTTDHVFGSVQMDPSHLTIRAARNGVGIILESSVLVADDVADGKLVPIFPDRARQGVGYWMYTPSAQGVRPSVDAVREWLKDVIAKDFARL